MCYFQNNGFARRIYDDSSAALQLRGFYNEIGTPLLSGVNIQYLDGTSNKTSLTTNSFENFFDGSEIVVAGEIMDNTVSRFVSNITGRTANGTVSFDMDVDMREISSEASDDTAGLRDVTRRLWAYLTINDLLRKAKAATNKTDSDSMKKRALELSLKVTLYIMTSLSGGNMLEWIPGGAWYYYKLCYTLKRVRRVTSTILVLARLAAATQS